MGPTLWVALVLFAAEDDVEGVPLGKPLCRGKRSM